MAKKNPFEAFEGMHRSLSRFESTLRRFNTENYARLVDNLAKVPTVDFAIKEAVGRQVKMVKSLDTRISNYVIFNSSDCPAVSSKLVYLSEVNYVYGQCK